MATRPKPSAPAPEPGEVAARRRQDLLESALSLLAEGGLEGLRTRDVAARAGVNISTLHYYFGTKEALLLALVEHASAKFLAHPPARRPRPGAPALRTHLLDAWRTFQAEPHLAAALQELVLRGQRDPATGAAFRALHDGWNASLEALLRHEIAAGTLRSDLDPPLAARVVTSFIMGAMMQLGVNPAAFDFEDAALKLERWLGAPG